MLTLQRLPSADISRLQAGHGPSLIAGQTIKRDLSTDMGIVIYNRSLGLFLRNDGGVTVQVSPATGKGVSYLYIIRPNGSISPTVTMRKEAGAALVQRDINETDQEEIFAVARLISKIKGREIPPTLAIRHKAMKDSDIYKKLIDKRGWETLDF